MTFFELIYLKGRDLAMLDQTITHIDDFKTQFDIAEVFEVYSRHKNYEIINLNQNDDRCFIYFSSNAIYYPNTKEVFEDRIIKNNRFDWKKNIVSSARKVILIRDVFKTWYLKGVNAELNSVEKVLDFLKQETKGLRVTCLGSSAGGYAAVLFGCLLQAERVFSFSGQFSLFHGLSNEIIRREQPFLVESEEISKINKYYSLKKFISESKVPIFYFYPEGCDLDFPQAQEISDLPIVYPFAFRGIAHGQTCYPINFLDIFNKSSMELISLCQIFKDETIHPFIFSTRVSGWKKTILYTAEKILKRITLG